MSRGGCPNTGDGNHRWVRLGPGEKPWCYECGVTNGGPRVHRLDRDDWAPPCTHRFGHKWVPDVFRLERGCLRCHVVLPLTGRARNRALRVQRLGERQQWRCHYCLAPFDLSPVTEPTPAGFGHEPITEDHRVPRSAGGHRLLSNLVLACPTCNSLKADRTERQLRRDPRFQARCRWVERNMARMAVP